MKKCSISLSIREMEIKITMMHYFFLYLDSISRKKSDTTERVIWSKTQEVTSTLKDVEKKEFCILLVWV